MRRCIHPGWRVLFVVFLALPLRSGPLQAQEISALVPQTRVRVTALIPEVGKLEKMTGTIVSAGADSLVLQVDRGNSRVAMPWGAVRYLDESAGHRSRGSTVALGSLIFAATGAGLGLVLGQDCSTLTVDELCLFPRGEFTLFMGLVGAAGGAVSGLVAPRPEMWKARAVPLQAGLMPVSGGRAEISASMSF
jgi:hypothetical protein